MRPALGFLLLSACATLPISDGVEVVRQVVGPSRVLEILNRHQCAKCHTTESVFGAGGPRDVGAPAESRDVRLPTLASMERFRARWLREFLAAPSVVRPNLAERMITHALSPSEVEALIAGWGAVEEPPEPARPPASELARGAALFEAKQCGLCHLFGTRRFTVAAGWQFVKTPTIVPRALAPDLEHSRRRLTTETLTAWIENPATVKPTTAMPRVSVTPEEARAIAAWIAFDGGDQGPAGSSEALVGAAR